MFNFPWSKKKEKPMPESVKQAEKILAADIKALSAPALARKINQLNAPNKWAITRFAASGKLMKRYPVGGTFSDGDKGYTSPQRLKRRLRQIEKGMIQVTPEIQPTQEAVNEGGN